MVKIVGNPIFILLLYGAVVMPQVVTDTLAFGAGVQTSILPGSVHPIVALSQSTKSPASHDKVDGSSTLRRNKGSASAAWATAIALGAIATVAGSWLWDLGRHPRRKIHHA